MLSDKVNEVHEEASVEAETAAKVRRESLEHSFTPSLARRLSRQFIEQTRQSLPRSPSTSRDTSRYYQSPTRETLSLSELAKLHSDQSAAEYGDRSLDRGIRRANSLLEASSRFDRSPRRSISLFDDDDDLDDRLLPPLRHIMTLGRKYKESGRPGAAARRENFYGYRTDKIQEEPGDDAYLFGCREDSIVENGSASESASLSACNSNANLMDTNTTTSSVSVNRSDETTPTEESSSNLGDYAGKSNGAGTFESRLLAAENLIKESKLKNLTPQRFNPNLSCNYKDTDKCDKEALITVDPVASVGGKRRSCIPSLRLRSSSLTRESSAIADRRKSFAGIQDALMGSANQERSILSKFFRSGGKESESKDSNKSQKPKQHRISRFLRPDFFDTPREESQYVKEKEAQKAAENERRKSRFMRRKSESRSERKEDEKICKEQKNEINALQKDKLDSTVTVSSSSSESKNEERIERQSSKSSFLHSLEKKLERLRANDNETTTGVAKATMNGAADERKVRAAREYSAPPVESSCPVESDLVEVKRTLSVESVPSIKNKDVKSAPAKSRVTSVLGLFRTSADAKQNGNGRTQSAIMSKLKKSPPKCVKPAIEEEDAATSKIPTKFARGDNKSTRKTPEGKRSSEKAMSECKRSPPKEKLKESIVKDRKPLVEKQSRDVKRTPEKIAQSDSSISSDKTKLEKSEPPRKLSDESESQPKIVDNKHAESIVSSEDKKLMKTKKNISSLSRNESVARIDKGEDDKKTKKLVKSKESANKDEVDGTKKKKIVRVVKRVVKKSSDSSESKSDEKEKTSKPLIRKRIIATKKEKSPEGTNAAAQISKGNNPDNQNAVRSKQMESNVREASSAKSDDIEESARHSKTDVTMLGTSIAQNSSEANVLFTDLSQPNSVLQTASGCNKQLAEQRPSRVGLKLDLSKIPQHTFRHATPKRDSPKSGSPKVYAGSSKTDIPAAESDADKLMECLSKMTHHANITGNKIIIDKPLRAKDVAELKREVSECTRIIENHIESRHDRSSPRSEIVDSTGSKEDKKAKEITPEPLKEINDTNSIKVTKEPEDSEMFSPEEPESFDSWSICSADLNHNRGDLHSPTSPSYYLFACGDSSESVIDRIRRRSFYSRFNDRKRPSLTAPPPGISSATLPRRFSLNSTRERERSRLYNYGVHRTR